MRNPRTTEESRIILFAAESDRFFKIYRAEARPTALSFQAVKNRSILAVWSLFFKINQYLTSMSPTGRRDGDEVKTDGKVNNDPKFLCCPQITQIFAD